MTTQLNRAAPRRRAVSALALALVLAGALTAAGGLGSARAAPASVDLNSASLEEIMALPVPAEIARRIHDRRVYERFYANVFELMEIDGMTAELLEQLKPLVSTMPPPVLDASIARLSASFMQVQNFLGEEGASEGLADEYLDRLRNPEDINDLDLYDLMSYQNISPVDAAAIVRARAQLGRIEDERQLRGVDGLRYFSFRGLRDFVVYDPAQASPTELTGFYQTRFWETPFSDTDDELGNFATGRPRGRYTVDKVPVGRLPPEVARHGQFPGGVRPGPGHGQHRLPEVPQDGLRLRYAAARRLRRPLAQLRVFAERRGGRGLLGPGAAVPLRRRRREGRHPERRRHHQPLCGDATAARLRLAGGPHGGRRAHRTEEGRLPGGHAGRQPQGDARPGDLRGPERLRGPLRPRLPRRRDDAGDRYQPARGPRLRDLERLHQRLHRRERRGADLQVPPRPGRRGAGDLRQRGAAGRIRLPAGPAQRPVPPRQSGRLDRERVQPVGQPAPAGHLARLRHRLRQSLRPRVQQRQPLRDDAAGLAVPPERRPLHLAGDGHAAAQG
ncbi:MAG: helix-hairpin-helix domain-containing protein [bacterium]|nr:helix-hairpin-helix domain-containing protein [bacterium]